MPGAPRNEAREGSLGRPMESNREARGPVSKGACSSRLKYLIPQHEFGPVRPCYASARTLTDGCSVLVELRLENYAVVDNVAVEFAAGLNLLTGETGAGKSILIHVPALMLGDRASAHAIPSGARKPVGAVGW